MTVSVDSIVCELKAFEDQTAAVIARGFALHVASQTMPSEMTISEVMKLADLYASYILTGVIPVGDEIAK